MKNLKFELDDRQMQRYRDFQHTFPSQVLEEALEEDCCVTSPFTFEFTPSGLGPLVRVRGLGKVCDLTIDDDNEFCHSTLKEAISNDQTL